MGKKKYLLYIPLLFVMLIIASCPEPISEEVVAKVEDEGAPTIIVSTPSNNSLYRSSVSFSGRVKDDAANSIESFSFDVQNRSISGGVVISSGNVTQDSSAGTTPVNYNSSTGDFSFDFSTIDPDILTGRLFVNIEAVDWNGNTSEETVILYENTEGLYLDLTTPTIDTTYEASISIAGTVLDFNSLPISVENVDYIKWQLESDSRKLQIYPISTTDADNDGTILNNTFQFNVNDGSFSDSISMIGESGAKSFSFYAADLNGHIKEIEYNISDGNVSPDIIVDSVSPPVFTDNNRYFHIGDDISFSCHVGPSAKVIDSFTYRVTPGDGSASQTLTANPIINHGDGTATYYFTNSPGSLIDTSGFGDVAQILILEATAAGASESSTKNIFFNADNVDPSIDSTTVAPDNTYISFTISEPVWGSKFFGSIITKEDFKVSKVTGGNEVTITSLTDSSGTALSGTSGHNDMRLYFDMSDPDLLEDGVTSYRISSRNSSDTLNVYDKANNTLTNEDFTFRDLSKPFVETKTPAGTTTVTELPQDVTIDIEFNEEVVLVGSDSYIMMQKPSEGSATNYNVSLTDGDSDGKSNLVYTFAAQESGTYTVTVPGTPTVVAGVFKDTALPSGNILAEESFTFTITDNTPPEMVASSNSPTGTVNSTSTDIDLVFEMNEELITDQGSRNIKINNVTYGSQLTVVNGTGDATVTLDNIPLTAFANETVNTITIPAGSLKDKAGNDNAEFSWTFTLDTELPLIESKSPDSGGTVTVSELPSDISINITFDEIVTVKSGETAKINIDGSDVAVTVSDSGGKTSIDTVTHSFDAAGTHTITVPAVYEDSAGNSFTVDTWDFTISDNVAPALASGTNSPTGTVNSTSTDIDLVFKTSEELSTTLGSKVVNINGTEYGTLFTITNGTGEATITLNNIPFTAFNDEASNTITVPAGAFKDKGGNDNAEFGWSFNLDITHPLIESRTPDSGADVSVTELPSNVSLNIGFDEIVGVKSGETAKINIDGSDIAVTLSDSGGKTSINTVTHSFSAVGTHTITVPAVYEDSAGNAFTEVSWDFTISDSTAPTLSTTSPPDNDSAHSPDDGITMNFSENIAEGSGNILIKLYSDDSTSKTIAIADVTIAGAQLTIASSQLSGLTSGEQYYIDIASGVITDIAENSYAGIGPSKTGGVAGDKDNWNFIIDSVDPTLSGRSPLDGATAVSLSSPITMSFSENIYTGTGNMLIKLYSNDITVITIPTASLIISGTNVTINSQLLSLSALTSYYIYIGSGVFVDAAGNDYAGLTNKNNWNFTTE